MPRTMKAKKAAKPGVDRKAINTALANYQDAYAESETGGGGFTPEPGEYLCRLTGVKTGLFVSKGEKTKGEEHVRIVPCFEIAEGDLAGQSFDVFMSTVVPGLVKSFLAGLNGEEIDDIQLAVETAEGQTDTFYMIEAVPNKKNPKYTNFYVREIVED